MKINDDSITFLIKLKYETKPGEEIFIYGDNKDFGNWSSPKFKLSWSKGHIWQADYKLSKTIDFIKYKFVCHSKHYNIWEEGENRILSPSNIEYLPKTEDGKYILNCIWGYFQINFNIHYLLKNPSSNMRIVGGIDALSNWNNPIKMEFNEKKLIKAKDGNEIEGFWNITFLLNSKNKKNFNFQYRYSTYDEQTKTAIWEREPNRHIHILTDINPDNSTKIKENPDEYKLLTNSFLQILDVNFVADFIFNKMGEKNIYIGPYPQNANDIISLSKSNINAILNVQSEGDLKYRQINIKALKNKCKELNIEYVHYPIEDFNSDDLFNKLKGAGDELNTLLKKDKIVYVHCTAGMSRAAATVIIYLILYEDFNVESAKNYCKKYRPVICPNYDVINKIAMQFKPGSEMLEKTNSNININDEWKKLREKTNIENNNQNKSDKTNKEKMRKVKSKKKLKRPKSILKQSTSYRKESCHELGIKDESKRSITFILDNEWEERNLKRKTSEIINRKKFNLEKKEIEGIKKNLFPTNNNNNNNDKKFNKNKIKKIDNKPKENKEKDRKSMSVTLKLRDNPNNKSNNTKKIKIKKIIKKPKNEKDKLNNTFNIKPLDKINNNILKTDRNAKTKNDNIQNNINDNKLEDIKPETKDSIVQDNTNENNLENVNKINEDNKINNIPKENKLENVNKKNEDNEIKNITCENKLENINKKNEDNEIKNITNESKLENINNTEDNKIKNIPNESKLTNINKVIDNEIENIVDDKKLDNIKDKNNESNKNKTNTIKENININNEKEQYKTEKEKENTNLNENININDKISNKIQNRNIVNKIKIEKPDKENTKEKINEEVTNNKKNIKNIEDESESESESEELSLSLSESEDEEEEIKDKKNERSFINNINKNKLYKNILNIKNNQNVKKKLIVKKRIPNNLIDNNNNNNDMEDNKRSNSTSNNMKINFKNKNMKENNINEEKEKNINNRNNNNNMQFKKHGTMNKRIIRAYDEYNSDNRIISLYKKSNDKKKEIDKQNLINKDKKDKNVKTKYINNFGESSNCLDDINNEKKKIKYVKKTKAKNNYYNNSSNNLYFNNNKNNTVNKYINKIQNKYIYKVPHYKIMKDTISLDNNIKNIYNSQNNIRKVPINTKDDNHYINYLNDDSSSNNLEMNSNYNNYNNDTDKNNTNYNSDEESNTNTNDNINSKNKINKIEDSYDSNEGKLFKYNGINNIFNSGNFQENNTKLNINKNMKFFKPEKKNQYQNNFKYNTNMNMNNMNKKPYKPKRINNYHNSFKEIQNKNLNIDNTSNSERSISESISESVSQSLSESDSKNKKSYKIGGIKK